MLGWFYSVEIVDSLPYLSPRFARSPLLHRRTWQLFVLFYGFSSHFHSAKYELSIHLLYTHHKINMRLYIIACFSCKHSIKYNASAHSWLITLTLFFWISRSSITHHGHTKNDGRKVITANPARTNVCKRGRAAYSQEKRARRHENTEPGCLGRHVFGCSMHASRPHFVGILILFLWNYSFVHESLGFCRQT